MRNKISVGRYSVSKKTIGYNDDGFVEFEAHSELYEEKFSSFEDKLDEQTDEVKKGIAYLKEVLDENEYAYFVRNVTKINKSGKKMLLLVLETRVKTLIEGTMLRHISRGFDVDLVRIVVDS